MKRPCQLLPPTPAPAPVTDARRAFATLLEGLGMTLDQLLADKATLTQVLEVGVRPGMKQQAKQFTRQPCRLASTPNHTLGVSV